MSLLVESIKVKDGRIYNNKYHSARFNRTRKELFGIGLPVDLSNKVIVPAYAGKGLFKCRIEYDRHIRSIEFIPYQFKQVKTLRMVEAGDLDYSYKYIDRGGLNYLFEKRFGCDDILIVKKQRITDSSFANIIFRGEDDIIYTPASYLLPGTKRSYLLDEGIINEDEVTPASIRRFKQFKLINSMMDIGDTEWVDIGNICF